MKKSIGELSMTVIVIISITLVLTISSLLINNNNNIILFKMKQLLNINVTEKNEYLNLEDKKSYVSIEENIVEEIGDKETANLLQVNVKLDNSFNINQKTTNKLDKLTNKNIKKQNLNIEKNEYSYHKTQNSYFVTTTSEDKKTEYTYNYEVKKTIFGNEKYIYKGSVKNDLQQEQEKEDKLIESEKNKEFNIEANYNEEYISMATLNKNKSFSENKVLVDAIYESNIDKVVILNTYNKDVKIDNATGFFLTNGLIATSWTYISNALKSGTGISAVTNSNQNYNVIGVVAMDLESDFALLKLDTNVSKSVLLGSVTSGNEFLMISSFSGHGLSGKIGVNLNNSDLQTNSLYISKNNIGSPLFNANGEVIGMVNSNSVNTSMSNSISSNLLQKYKNIYSKLIFENINYYTFNELSKRFYLYGLEKEKTINAISKKAKTKYKELTNIEELIPLKLIKSYSNDNIVTLRYQNNTSIKNQDIIKNFIDNLKQNNYKEKLNTTKKQIFTNHQREITIYFEFDYIIIILEDLR